MKCRSCATELKHIWADLNTSPPSNSFLTEEELYQPEIYYPLQVFVCHECWLAQVDEHKHHEEIFSKNYVYFSSYSNSWLKHAKHYVENIQHRFEVGPQSRWIEVASNDGYLLQYVRELGIPCLGIEPTKSTADVAKAKGIKTICEFFSTQLGKRLAQENLSADVICANNVLAHVPNIHDFLGGFREILKPDGVATFEFPHLLNLMNQNQFDTIYHEHFSYLSLIALEPLFEKEGLRIFDVEEIDTHGGSLRLYASRTTSTRHTTQDSVRRILNKELQAGLANIELYQNFQKKIDQVKIELLDWLLKCKKNDQKVVAYGAAAKGNTLLNYCGIGKDLIAAIADASPHKQGMYLPGSRIPVVSLEELKGLKPDAVLILPWNIKDEVAALLRQTLPASVDLMIAIPKLKPLSEMHELNT